MEGSDGGRSEGKMREGRGNGCNGGEETEPLYFSDSVKCISDILKLISDSGVV